MWWLSTYPSPMTLTLDFQGQILKMLYLRNGRADWHGTKGMWVDRMLHPLCDFQLWPQPWPWPWIFKVKFWKSRISGIGWPIDMGWKGCESIECWTHVVTFNLPLTHDLDLGFSMPCWLCSHHRIIIKFSGVITTDQGNVHAKGQGQRSKVKFTEVTTQLDRFRTVTPVSIHIWWWNDAYSLMLLRRGALLFFKVICQISRSHGSKNRRIWLKLGVSGL